MNAGKCKIMVSNNWEDSTVITAEGTNVEVVEDFCCLGSHLSRTGNCDKECMIRIRKAASVFGRLVNIWKSKNISLAVKTRLYESLVISTLLYGAESWPLSVTQMKKLEASHHKFQRRLLGSHGGTRSEMKTSEKTGSRKLEDIIKERRLGWLGHVLRMDNSRTARQATHW